MDTDLYCYPIFRRAAGQRRVELMFVNHRRAPGENAARLPGNGPRQPLVKGRAAIFR
jgi:hypothetical protein